MDLTDRIIGMIYGFLCGAFFGLIVFIYGYVRSGEDSFIEWSYVNIFIVFCSALGLVGGWKGFNYFWSKVESIFNIKLVKKQKK